MSLGGTFGPLGGLLDVLGPVRGGRGFVWPILWSLWATSGVPGPSWACRGPGRLARVLNSLGVAFIFSQSVAQKLPLQPGWVSSLNAARMGGTEHQMEQHCTAVYIMHE